MLFIAVVDTLVISGQHYQLYRDALTWQNALRHAQGRIFRGVTGHVLSISSTLVCELPLLYLCLA